MVFWLECGLPFRLSFSRLRAGSEATVTDHHPVAPAVICWRTMGGDLRDSAIRASMADLVNAVTGLQQSGQVDVAQALKNLAERVLGCDLLPQTRHEIIENLVFIGQQAQMLPEKRKRGVVKAALSYLKHAMQPVEPLHDAWHTHGRTLENFFHF
jgi:hypothetical protein